MKIQLINYKPYEYELLLEKLNKLGEKGYRANDLGFITFFKKTQKTQYYAIDFYNPEGESRNDRLTDRDIFISKYRDKGFTPIYVKDNMYVFVSDKNIPVKINWNRKLDVIKHSLRLKHLIIFIVSIILASMFSYYTLASGTDNFLSYGITIAYIGILLLFITAAFRNYFNFYELTVFKSKIENKDPYFNLSKLKSLRKIYFTLALLTIIMIGGGLIEDMTNSESFSINEHPIVTLEDIGIQTGTELSTQTHSSFTIPHTYISLESTPENSKENYALYIKEFQYNSIDKAKQRFDYYSKTPSQYGCQTITQKDNIIYGYQNKSLAAIIIQKDKSLLMIIPSFYLSDNQAQAIVDFYK